MAKAKRFDSGGDIETMSEEKLNRLSGAAYDKFMPSPEPGEAAPRMMLPSTGAGAGRGFVNPRNASEKPKAARAPKKMAGGGSASARADGCVTRGKTKGTFV